MKDTLVNKAIKALIENNVAVLEGAADELSFGAYGKYVPGADERMKESNRMATAGRVGSYFTPTPQKLKALAKAPDALKKLITALESSKLGMKATEFAGKNLVTKGATAATKAAAKGVASGEAQHYAREGVRALPGENVEETPSDDASRRMLEATLGIGGKVLAKGAERVAPWIYNHPALVNKYDPEKSEELARELMEEGTWGTLSGAFKNRAQQFKDKAKPAFDRILDRVGVREAADAQKAAQLASASLNGFPVPTPKGMVHVPSKMGKRLKSEVRDGHATGMGDAEEEALKGGYQKAAGSLKPDQYGTTDVFDINENIHKANKRLAKLSARDQARRQGAQGLGENTAETDRVESLRDAYDDMYQGRMKEAHQFNELRGYKKAKETHGKGADLARNLQAHELFQQSGTGHIFNDMLRNALSQSVKSAPIRTGLGVMLNKLSKPTTISKGGRIAELRSRNNGETPVQAEPGSDELLLELPDAQGDDLPSDEDARKASAKKFGFGDDILAGIDDPADPEKNAAAVRAHKKLAPRQYKAAPKQEDDENLLIKLPPPR